MGHGGWWTAAFGYLLELLGLDDVPPPEQTTGRSTTLDFTHQRMARLNFTHQRMAVLDFTHTRTATLEY